MEQAVVQLASATKVVVLTGAGVSAESGVPTFRGKDGLWHNYRAEELATPQAFRKNPALVWEWYDWRRSIIAKAKPNQGHVIIAAMEKHFPNFLLITQNVDALHERAGNRKLVELHGNIWKVRCTNCRQISHLLDVPLTLVPPVCETCGQIVRPHIVWFGENYDQDLLRIAQEAMAAADLVIVVGTSGAVWVPMQLAYLALQSGAYGIEINPNMTEMSSKVQTFIQAEAGKALPELWRQTLAQLSSKTSLRTR